MDPHAPSTPLHKIRVLVSFHFEEPTNGKLPWQTDVLELNCPLTYEKFIYKILDLLRDTARFVGESWETEFPWSVMWLSQDHHGQLRDSPAKVPAFQTRLRRGNWEAVLCLMQQRGLRDVICVGVSSPEKIKGKVPGWEAEREQFLGLTVSRMENEGESQA